MQKVSERPAPARLGRFFRMLVGESHTDPDDVVDLTDGPPDLARIEVRLQRLERGVRAVADGVQRSHGELREAIRTMDSEMRERDRVTRSETQRMLWQALGPVAASMERLSDSLRGLSPVIAEGDRIAAADAASWSLTTEPPPPEPDIGRQHPTEELKGLPARPFDLD
jgi:hypothetical protein